MYYELRPAYGRDYKSKAEVLNAFRRGDDFEGDYNLGYKYCSIADLKPGDTAMLRYKADRMVTPCKI
jgi:hypothetical protein